MVHMNKKRQMRITRKDVLKSKNKKLFWNEAIRRRKEVCVKCEYSKQVWKTACDKE